MENKSKNPPPPPPPHQFFENILLEIYGHLRCRIASFAKGKTLLLKNAHRIISVIDGGVYWQNQVCTANLQPKNIICIVYFQKAFFTIYSYINSS